MYSALFFPGKLEWTGVAATYALPSTSCHLFVRDLQTFIAANGTSIQVYRRKLMSLDLGLRRNFVFPFFICNVSNAIIGADFLHYFNIKPDLRNRSLFDTSTKLNCNDIIRNSNIFSIKTHVIDNDFSKLLNDFPNIVKEPCANQTVKHNVVHYIDTFGPPVCAKPRRMAPDRPDGHGYELVSSVRALVPQKFSVEEELMHVKHVEVKSPHFGVMWKFGRGVISSEYRSKPPWDKSGCTPNCHSLGRISLTPTWSDTSLPISHRSRFRREVEAMMELRASWTSMGRTLTGFKQHRNTTRTTNYSAFSEITTLQTFFSFSLPSGRGQLFVNQESVNQESVKCLLKGGRVFRD
ncbi:peptidase A2 domain-containing protein [Trichonephila clavipes]|nr:peptidase A2 domain-containing protein [Trichonephila clavipes]